MNATAALGPLRDIRGLDPMPWWPPAPGWWLLALAGLAVLLALLWGWHRWRVKRLGWRIAARRELRALRRRLPGLDGKQAAAEASELIRRIAMARCGRAACAGLSGEAWLAWLAARDPQGFDWRREGRFLLTLPYAPRVDDPATRAQVARLLAALGPWLAAPDEPSAPASAEVGHV